VTVAVRGGGDAGQAPPLRRNGAFRTLWFAQALSQLGHVTGTIAYPLLVLEVHGTAAWAGVLGFAASAAGLAARLPAGFLCDRFDRRRILLAGSLLRAAAMALLAAGAAAGTVPLAAVIAVAVVDGAILEPVRYAERAALRHVVRPEDVTTAAARGEARSQAAALLGPALGGWLFAASAALPFAANAAGHLMSAALVGRLRRPLQERRDGAGALRPGPRELLAGFGWIARTPQVRALVLASLGPNLVFGGVTLIILAAAHDRGESSAAIGTALSAAGLGGLAGALAAPALLRRLRPAAVLLGTAWLLPAVVAGLAFAPGTAAAAVLLSASVFTVPVLNALLVTYQVRLAGDGLQGRVFGATGLAMGAAQPLGPLLGGVGHDLAGPGPALLALAGLLALCAAGVTALPAARGLRHPEDRDPEADPAPGSSPRKGTHRDA